MRAFATVAAAGAAGIVLLKLLAGVILPMLGMFFGLMGLLFKIGLFVAVGLLLYKLFRRRRDRDETYAS